MNSWDAQHLTPCNSLRKQTPKLEIPGLTCHRPTFGCANVQIGAVISNVLRRVTNIHVTCSSRFCEINKECSSFPV